MNIGTNLCDARKKRGLSQEQVAENLGVSRQTISKWETGETTPDIRQAKRLALLYHQTLDDLITFDVELQHIEQVIEQTDETLYSKVDWTRVWSKRYPILASYQDEVDIPFYAVAVKGLLKKLRADYGYDDQDACLVIKDILSHVWKDPK